LSAYKVDLLGETQTPLSDFYPVLLTAKGDCKIGSVAKLRLRKSKRSLGNPFLPFQKCHETWERRMTCR
jgi:hypothetical protein